MRGSFQGIEVLKRGFSPRIVSAYVLGSAGRTLVSGPELAARLGLYSTWAYFRTREGPAIKPEPDRSGSSPLVSPAPAAAPSAPASQGGVRSASAAEASAASSSSNAAAGAGGGTSAGAGDSTAAGAGGGTAAPA